jgi:hypothetical protein
MNTFSVFNANNCISVLHSADCGTIFARERERERERERDCVAYNIACTRAQYAENKSSGQQNRISFFEGITSEFFHITSVLHETAGLLNPAPIPCIRHSVPLRRVETCVFACRRSKDGLVGYWQVTLNRAEHYSHGMRGEVYGVARNRASSRIIQHCSNFYFY